MLALGRWQLVRADEKIALLDAAAVASVAAPVDATTVADPEAAAARYLRVRAEGRWLENRQFLWDNRAHAARPGLEVVTPLLLDDGRAVLVNRGWMPLPATRAELPDVSPSAAGSADGGPDGIPGARVSLTGLASRPSKGFAGGEPFVADAPWPRWLQYFDYDALGDALGVPLAGFVLQPQRGAATPDGAAGPIAAAGEAALLVENWRPAASGPEKHWSYAVQWFAMAAALTALFVFVNLRRPDAGDAAATDDDRRVAVTPPSPPTAPSSPSPPTVPTAPTDDAP